MRRSLSLAYHHGRHKAYAAELTEWDQSVVYQLVEKVTVLAKDKIRVTFRNGTEVEQEIEQLDWRNAS